MNIFWSDFFPEFRFVCIDVCLQLKQVGTHGPGFQEISIVLGNLEIWKIKRVARDERIFFTGFFPEFRFFCILVLIAIRASWIPWARVSGNLDRSRKSRDLKNAGREG